MTDERLEEIRWTAYRDPIIHELLVEVDGLRERIKKGYRVHTVLRGHKDDNGRLVACLGKTPKDAADTSDTFWPGFDVDMGMIQQVTIIEGWEPYTEHRMPRINND